MHSTRGNVQDHLQRLRSRAALILSYHDFRGTRKLEQTLQEMTRTPADFYKLVTTATTLSDNVTMMKFLQTQSDKHALIGLCMGEQGIISRVLSVRYFPGCFLDARHKECAVRNEQLWLDLEETDGQRLVRVKQISGAIARRIVCWLKPAESVRIGERLGMIKFGSRTELYLPAGENIEVLVKVGDAVKGASSPLVRYR